MSWPKVPAAFATDTDAHQYRLQKQLVPLASGDQGYEVWYRVKALPGTKTPVYAPVSATNRYQVGGTNWCLMGGQWHRVLPWSGAATCPPQRHRLVTSTGAEPIVWHRLLSTNRCLWPTPINTPTSPPPCCRELTVHGSWVRGGEANFCFCFSKKISYFSP